MSTLYHYCTADSLKEILKNKTLRLSDIRKSNDPREIIFLSDEYCEWIRKSYANPNLAGFNAANKIMLDETTFLVACFSKKDDDLHMWSCYGNEGVCIHFNREKLENYIKLIKRGIKEDFRALSHDDSKSPALELKDVEYHDSISLEKYFSSKILKTFDDIVKIYYDSPIIKSNFFECEQEVRIIHVHKVDSIDEDINYLSRTDDKGFFIEEIEFKSISDNKFSHKMVVDIPFDLKIIEKITLGPNCKLTKKDINELFYINKINENIIVEQSKGSYR